MFILPFHHTWHFFSQCRKQPCMVLNRVLTKVIGIQEKIILGSEPITNEIHGTTSLNTVGPQLCPRRYQISVSAGCLSLASVIRLLTQYFWITWISPVFPLTIHTVKDHMGLPTCDMFLLAFLLLCCLLLSDFPLESLSVCPFHQGQAMLASLFLPPNG